MARTSYISAKDRNVVARRAKYRCEYCQSQQDLCPESFEVDHVIPRALDGRTALGNLCYACPVCNNAKRSQTFGRDPRTSRRVRLFDPRRQLWMRHFRWSEDGSRIIGKSVIGRATVEALDMNRSRIVQIRLLWAAMRLHPPND